MRNAAYVTGAVLGIFAVMAPTVVRAQDVATSPSRLVISQPAIPRASIDRNVAQTLVTSSPTRFATLPLHSAARAQQTPSDPAGEPRTFFASRKGIVVLAVLGAGIGYGIYSKVHDRIHTKNPDR